MPPKIDRNKNRSFLQSGGWGPYCDRRANSQDPLPRILIVCEGEKTEPNYFRAFRIASAEVIVDGLGLDPLGLVRAAITRRDEAREEAVRSGDPDNMGFAQVWCVFDRDEWTPDRFNAAFQLAKKDGGVEIAYSNQAFEVWYLLHFEFHDMAHDRSRYKAMLTERLKRSYHKNDRAIYEDLITKQPAAIRHAKNLHKIYHPDHNPERDNPCTTVFQLVEALNKFLR